MYFTFIDEIKRRSFLFKKFYIHHRNECSESCKARRRDFDNDVKHLRRENKIREDHCRQLEDVRRQLEQEVKVETKIWGIVTLLVLKFVVIKSEAYDIGTVIKTPNQ